MNLRSVTARRTRRLAAVPDQPGPRDTGPTAERRLALATACLDALHADRDRLQGMRAHPARDQRLRLLDRAITQHTAEIASLHPLPTDDIMDIAVAAGVAR